MEESTSNLVPNRHLLVKNLDAFPKNSKNFLTNPNTILTIDVTLKIIFDHAVFQLLSESAFSLEILLLLNNSIS